MRASSSRQTRSTASSAQPGSERQYMGGQDMTETAGRVGTGAAYRLESFIEDVRGTLAETGVTEAGLDRLGRLMQRLVAEGDLIQPGDLDKIAAGEKSS